MLTSTFRTWKRAKAPAAKPAVDNRDEAVRALEQRKARRKRDIERIGLASAEDADVACKVQVSLIDLPVAIVSVRVLKCVSSNLQIESHLLTGSR